MQVCKYESMQVCNYESMQLCKYASMQVCKYAHIPKSAFVTARQKQFTYALGDYARFAIFFFFFFSGHSKVLSNFSNGESDNNTSKPSTALYGFWWSLG